MEGRWPQRWHQSPGLEVKVELDSKVLREGVGKQVRRQVSRQEPIWMQSQAKVRVSIEKAVEVHSGERAGLVKVVHCFHKEGNMDSESRSQHF